MLLVCTDLNVSIPNGYGDGNFFVFLFKNPPDARTFHGVPENYHFVTSMLVTGEVYLSDDDCKPHRTYQLPQGRYAIYRILEGKNGEATGHLAWVRDT